MHLVGHLAIGYILTKVFGYYYPSDQFWAVIFCAIAPDSDSFVSDYITRKIQHREIFHSLPFAFGFAALSSLAATHGLVGTAPFEMAKLLVATILAVVSHYVADVPVPRERSSFWEERSITPSKGVKLLYPFSSKELRLEVSRKTFRDLTVAVLAIAFVIWAGYALVLHENVCH